MPGRSRCCVPTCENREDKSPAIISFHRIPKDEDLKEKWIEKIFRGEGPEFPITQSSRVCSVHFREDDFRKHLHTRKRLLTFTAVPSIFSWNTEANSPEAERLASANPPSARLSDDSLYALLLQRRAQPEPQFSLLKTSDSKLVPVVMVHQTCHDYDDLLEIENS